MLYEPDQFDRLIDEPWVRAYVEGAIATIVADVDAAFGLDRLWPVVNEWDEYHDGQPAKVLYTGAAGVSWTLETLRRGGHAETSLDLVAAALRALELERAEPDAAEDEHYRPGSLLHGERFISDRLNPIIEPMVAAAAENPDANFDPPSREAWYELHDSISG